MLWFQSTMAVDEFTWWQVSTPSLHPNSVWESKLLSDSNSKVHGANMGSTWVLQAADGPHVGPMNLAIRESLFQGWVCNEFINVNEILAAVDWAHFRSLAQSKLKLCSSNHRPGYESNLPCDWLSTAWAYSEQETEDGPRSWSLCWHNSLGHNDTYNESINWIITDSAHSFPPVWCQAITWSGHGSMPFEQWEINLGDIWNKIQLFPFKKIHLKVYLKRNACFVSRKFTQCVKILGYEDTFHNKEAYLKHIPCAWWRHIRDTFPCD